ncbi:MAG: hypothetical protein U0414_24995 [Polyangiaceae bacterium]
MPEAKPAARKYDAITHSLGQFGAIVGAVVGAVVGGLICVAAEALSFGFATPVVLGIIIATTGLGAALGKWLFNGIKVKSGRISDGSPTIFYGSEIRNAARMTDPLECNDPLVAITDNPIVQILSPAAFIASKTGLNKMLFGHGGAFLWDGVNEIFYDTDILMPSRIESLTSCGGNVSEGIDTVILFGDTVHIADPSLASEDLAAISWALTLLDIAGLFTGVGEVTGGVKIALFLTSLGLKVGSFVALLTGHPQLANKLTTIDGIISLGTGLGNLRDKATLIKDVILGGTSTGVNIATAPPGMEQQNNPEINRYTRRVRQRITKPWYQTQYQLAPAGG